ncbi:hypothetical protein GUI12_01565 [Anaplasmataceae bacterium AB001_6]|nr:hypothetical protein GUI12_01565 [Anaplasmataceae bacterium AB001_6]
MFDINIDNSIFSLTENFNEAYHKDCTFKEIWHVVTPSNESINMEINQLSFIFINSKIEFIKESEELYDFSDAEKQNVILQDSTGSITLKDKIDSLVEDELLIYLTDANFDKDRNTVVLSYRIGNYHVARFMPQVINYYNDNPENIERIRELKSIYRTGVISAMLTNDDYTVIFERKNDNLFSGLGGFMNPLTSDENIALANCKKEMEEEFLQTAAETEKGNNYDFATKTKIYDRSFVISIRKFTDEDKLNVPTVIEIFIPIKFSYMSSDTLKQMINTRIPTKADHELSEHDQSMKARDAWEHTGKYQMLSLTEKGTLKNLFESKNGKGMGLITPLFMAAKMAFMGDNLPQQKEDFCNILRDEIEDLKCQIIKYK